MRALDRFEEFVISSMLAAMTLLTFVQVVLRYVFNVGLTWAFEATTVCFALMIFTGLAYGVRVGAHIGVDALARRLPPGGQRVVAMLVVLVCLGYAGLVIAGGLDYVQRMHVVGINLDDLPVPVWLVRAVLPAGYALLTLRLLQALWSLWQGDRQNLAREDEAQNALRQHQDAIAEIGGADGNRPTGTAA